MKQLLLITVSLLVMIEPVSADDLTILRMSEGQRNQLFNYLEKASCTCGCGMKMGQCLHEDQTCPVSPELTRSAIQKLVGSGNNDQSRRNNPKPAKQSGQRTKINNSQNGSVVIGQDCSYVSAGGITVKDCGE